MSNPSKAKGTRAETKVVRYLDAHGIAASRRPLHGSKDEGDIILKTDSMPSPCIMEVKAGKQTANPNRKQLEKWLDQAWAERGYSNMLCILVVTRYNRRIKDADCWIQYIDNDGEFVRSHLFLDELVEQLK